MAENRFKNLQNIRDTAAGVPTAPQKAQERRKADPAPQEPKTPERASRAGKSLIAGHFPQEVRTQLKIVAAEQNKTVQQLLGEALNLLFAGYRKAEIAPTERD